MPFTVSEREVFIAALESRGWQFRDEILWSLSGGLYFGASHFADWTPVQVKEIFLWRAARLGKHPDFQKSAAENHDVHWAADVVLDSALK